MKIIAILTILFLTNFSGIFGGKISSSMLESYSNNQETKDCIVEFESVLPEVSKHTSLKNLQGEPRRSKMIQLMKEHTLASQLKVSKALNQLGLGDRTTQFWIDNKMFVTGLSVDHLKALQTIPGSFTMREPLRVNTLPILSSPGIKAKPFNRDIKALVVPQWGVAKIGAPAAFGAGTNGKDIVVAIIDTGVQFTHEALKDNFLGGKFSWMDAINNQTTPYDDNGHGTHCMGIAVGTQNGIGVAPGAKWMACKGLDKQGSGSEQSLTTCGQFLACPNTSTGRCTGQPHVISCSWGGSAKNPFYNGVIESWTALDIVPVFAIGNSGPSCGSSASPGDQCNLISVGSTDPNDDVSSFSSRNVSTSMANLNNLNSLNGLTSLNGVTSFDIFNRLLTLSNLVTGTPGQEIPSQCPNKPDVAAPGSNIVSASFTSDTGYVTMSGTSMATPCVAGAVALIRSRNKTMTFPDVKERLRDTAVSVTKGGCPIPTSLFPMFVPNSSNYGRISVPGALKIK